MRLATKDIGGQRCDGRAPAERRGRETEPEVLLSADNVPEDAGTVDPNAETSMFETAPAMNGATWNVSVRERRWVRVLITGSRPGVTSNPPRCPRTSY